MDGIEAINAANGWNLAALGILVVFSSLIILSIIISQLHKILNLWSKYTTILPWNETLEKNAATSVYPKPGSRKKERTDEKPQQWSHEHTWPEDTREIAEIWRPLIEKLDDPFPLAELYKLATKNDFPHPHLTINRLRRENILVHVENQSFSFKYKRRK